MLNLVIDIHGILADYVKAFCEYHELLGVYENWPKGEYNIKKVTGFHWSEFPLVGLARLPAMPDFLEIMPLIVEHKLIFVSRASNEEMAKCTQMWLDQHIQPAQCYFCAKLKALSCSSAMVQDCILIDDCEDEIKAWENAGGQTILLPRPWNSGEGNAAEYLRDQLYYYDELQGTDYEPN